MSKDEIAWQAYQNGFASNYTRDYINGLDCSDVMKAQIAANVKAYQPGGELPAAGQASGYNNTFCVDYL